jgi:hypothetical protein
MKLMVAASLLLPTSVGLCFAETSPTKLSVGITFDVDGKRVPGPSMIDFSSRGTGKTWRVPIKHGRFTAPDEVTSAPVDVSLRLAGRRLRFTGVYPAKFRCDWTVGIDTPPFDSENQLEEPGVKAREFWYIAFEPHEGDGTRATVIVR